MANDPENVSSKRTARKPEDKIEAESLMFLIVAALRIYLTDLNPDIEQNLRLKASVPLGVLIDESFLLLGPRILFAGSNPISVLGTDFNLALYDN